MTIYRKSDCTYGRPRITVELIDLGIRVNHKRVGRLMREAGIKGVSRRRSFVITTHRNKRDRPAPDLVQRHFKATSINHMGCGHDLHSCLGRVPVSGRGH